ncbi:MAG: phosphoribosyltransferase [Halioglobus sp.]|nr:phosphoribosyltransferase [Halioglobus sp.]
MSTYQQQVHCSASEIDINFWRAPKGVSVPDDELSFLLVPDAVEAMAVFTLSQQVNQYQKEQSSHGEPITCALMASMGGMLPGILLYDHLVKGRPEGTLPIDFGTVGISLYKGPNERHENPQVQQDVSIPILNQTVLIIDDLGDRGGTMEFLIKYIAGKGAKKILTLALYMKPMALSLCPVDFFFGELQQDTWIITPREYVETMVKRVPVWKNRGASVTECRRRLVEIIGYPQALTDYYLEQVYTAV